MKITASRRVAFAAGLIVSAGAAMAQSVALDYNWNGMVHAGEGLSPNSASGFRSLADRGLEAGAADSLGGETYTVQTDEFSYSLVSASNVVDIVFVGTREGGFGNRTWDNQADEDRWGVEPEWWSGESRLASHTSDVSTGPLGSSFAFGFLHHATNGGADGTLTLNFSGGQSTSVTFFSGDWFANGSPNPGTLNPGLASVETLAGPLSGGDGFEARDTVDVAVAGAAPLSVYETTVTYESLLANGFDVTGLSLESVTFSVDTEQYTRQAIGIFGAAVIPAPGAGLAFLAAGGLAGARRRRR